MSYHVQRVDPLDPHASKFLDHLQGANRYAIGFLPFAALQEAIARGRVMQAFENGEPCGYMIHGKPRKQTRILQMVVANDARRVQHATALAEALVLLCSSVPSHEITLHCAEDLESNRFWRAIGFEPVGRRLKSKHGKRWQIAYRKELPAKKLAAMIATKRVERAGVANLQRLLVKGDAQIGSLDLAKFRSRNHSIDLA